MSRVLSALALAVGLSGCSPLGEVVSEVVMEAKAVDGGGVVVAGDGDVDRWRKALSLVPARAPHDEVVRRVSREKGAIFVDDPTRIKGLPAGVDLQPLFGADGPSKAWLGGAEDDAALAKALIERGGRHLLVRRDVSASIDRNQTPFARLYHDDHHPFFKLLGVDAHFYYYRVMEKPLAFPPELARIGTTQIRQMLKGEPIGKLPDLKSEDGKKWNLVASVRTVGGQELSIGMCLKSTFQECLMELARDLEREHRRGPEILGMGQLDEIIDDLILELHRVTERAGVFATEEEDLLAIWEMGIDGAVMIDRNVDRAAIFPGSIAYTRAFRDPDRFLRHAATQFRLSSKRPWRDPGNTLEKIRTIHYMDWPGRGLVQLFRGIPFVPMETVNLEVLAQSVVMGGEWYLENLDENGRINYKFWPAENRYSDEYNLVRHTLGVWNLVQAWYMDPRPEFLEGARRCLDFTLQYRVDEGDMTYFRYNNNVKLGTVVVQLMGLIDLAKATGSHEWDDLMVRMGNFTLFMQEESGKFDPYYVPDDHPYAGQTNDIVPGEALLALAMLAEYTGDHRWLEPSEKYFDYYIPWWNERVVKRRNDMPWPREHYAGQDRLDLVQFGPWTVMAANKLHEANGDARAAKFGLEIGRWMIENYQWTAENAPFPDYVGGYYKMEGELPAMQAFCYAEGTAAAYALAMRFAPEERAFFERSTREAARFALVMQSDAWSGYPFSRPEVVYGGTRYAMNETKVRVDYVHHALDSVYHYVIHARNDPDLPAFLRRRFTEQVSLEVSPPTWVEEGVDPVWWVERAER